VTSRAARTLHHTPMGGRSLGSRIISNKRLRLASINYRGWVKPIIEDVGKDIERSALSMGLEPSGIIRLPTKMRRWSVLRSPFVHKSAFDQFEQREHNRLIEIYGKGTQTEDATKTVQLLRYIEHTILPAHAGARAKFVLFSDERLCPELEDAGFKQVSPEADDFIHGAPAGFDPTQAEPPPSQPPRLSDLDHEPAAGDSIFVLRAAWPRYACHEYGGAGWAATILETTRYTCLVSFDYACAPDGRPSADERVNLSMIRQFA